MDLFGYHIPSLAAVAAAWVAFYKAFAQFDNDQSEANRRLVRDWIVGVKVDEQKWSQFFKDLFASLFGSRQLSLKCVIRSCLLSIFLIILILTFLYAEDRNTLLYFGPSFLFEAALCAALIACSTDYLSLWKTRFLLTRTASFQNIFVVVLVLIGDVVATTVLYLLIGTAVWTIWGSYINREPISFLSFIVEFKNLISGTFSPSPQTTPFYLAALLTSAWLWLYLVVAYAMRILSLVPYWAKLLSTVSDFDNHPVRTIGYVAATASAAIVAAAVII